MRRPLISFALVLLGACAVGAGIAGSRKATVNADATLDQRAAHLHEVRSAEFCASCHPEATAEHRQNTHGRAFTDAEVRLATARFSYEGCIACHTPRPIFETGIGMNPIKQLHHLEEGNDCFSCHAKSGYDYSTFEGGPECKRAFDDRAGAVEACASCHRNHGTPYQWENAHFGKQAGNVCIDCHMPEVTRPVAVGMPATKTRRHTFFASRSASQLKMAYAYDVKLDGNEVVVTLENAGAGHNFPTELKQRAVESLVVIRDVAGREVARSRDVHRDPYKRPYGLTLPVNTQIPSGEKREHRVPVPISAGTIETTLFYKLYYPIDDNHPDMSRTLEQRSMPFAGITPSTKPITTPPEIHAALPEAIPVEAASVGNLADFAQPKIGRVEVNIPDGTHDGDVEKLIALFQFPVLNANRAAQDVLVKLGPKAVPALIEALGSWDNKTWTQSQNVLLRMGAAAQPAVIQALSSKSLYVRFHAREILPRFDTKGAVEPLVASLGSKDPLDRASSAETLGKIGAKEAAPSIRPLLDTLDFDDVACAARALGMLGDRESIPAMKVALNRWRLTVETARDVAWGLAALGDASGIPFLLDGLDHPDDLVRESFFESFLDVTGKSMGYTPMLPREERLAALAELRDWWAAAGGASALRRPRSLELDAKLRAEIAKLVKDVGGNDFDPPDAAKTDACVKRLLEIGTKATPQIADGLKWPAGFADKRAALLRVLSERPDPEAIAALIDATKDPVIAVALWAVRGLENVGDPQGLPALRAFENRFESLASVNRLPPGIGHPEEVRVSIGRARMRLGDAGGARLLARLLFSGEPTARAYAEEALRNAYGTESAGEPALAAEMRATLQGLPAAREAQIQAMREIWQKLVEEAEAASEGARTPEAMRAALAKYDFAEEAATRYARLDPRAFEVDFRRVSAGANTLAVMLYEDGKLADGIVARDLTSVLERRGWAQSRSGLTATFEPDAILLETTADAGGNISFAIGGPGGSTVPLEWWRDYDLQFDLEVVKKGVRILDRYDPIWAISQEVALNTDGPSTQGGVHVPVVEGQTYRVAHSVEGGDVIHRQTNVSASASASGGSDGDGSGADEIRAPVAAFVRKGGVVFQLDPGAKVRLRNLRVKVLRTDAAEELNAQLATPGR